MVYDFVMFEFGVGVEEVVGGDEFDLGGFWLVVYEFV